MDNNENKTAIEQIPVPKEKSKKKFLASMATAAVLLGVTVASGFVNPTMNKVLANTPL